MIHWYFDNDPALFAEDYPLLETSNIWQLNVCREMLIDGIEQWLGRDWIPNEVPGARLRKSIGSLWED